MSTLKKATKKAFTIGVVASTIVWSIGVFGLAGIAVAAYAPVAGDKIKVAGNSAVYYIGQDSKRHLFSTLNTYEAWYGKSTTAGYWAAQGIKTITASEFDAISSGNNLVLKPGKLMKFENSAKLYVVSTSGKLAELSDVATAKSMFGNDYAAKVNLIQAGFEPNYDKSLPAITASNAVYPDGSVISNGGITYFIEGGKARKFTTGDALTANGFKTTDVFAAASIPAAGSNITGAEDAIRNPVITGSVVAAGSGALSVALASDTPAASIAINGAARVPFTKINLTASSAGDVVIDTWSVLRTGIGQDAEFSSIDIIDASNNLPINDSGKTLNTNHIATFSEDLTIPAGTTKSVIIAGNIASGASYGGDVPALALNAITLKSGTISGSFPVVGNAMTINGAITIGTATVQRGAYTNATTSLEVGKIGYTLMSFQVTAGSAEDVAFSEVKVYQGGSATLSSDLSNIKLYDEGSYVADGTVSGNYIKFSFPSRIITKGQVKQYQIKADIAQGSARTVYLQIYRNTDLLVKGQTYGAYIAPTFSGTGAAGTQTANPVLWDNTFTISTGTFRVGSSNTVAAGNITIGSSQVLGAFEFEAKGEAVNISALTLTVASSSASQIEDALNSVKIVDANGNTVAGPTDVTNNALTVAFTDTFRVPVGLNVYKVVGTLATNGGWATNNTITVSFNPATVVTAKGDSTGLSITPTPNASISANTQTIKVANLVVTKNSIPTNQTVITKSNGVLIGSWTLDASNSGEDIRITSIGVRASTTGKITNLTLKDGSSALSPVNSNPVSSNNANTTSTFALSDPLIVTKGASKVLNFYGDIPSNASNGEVDAWGLTDTSSTSNNSIVAYGVSTGNRAAVTLTANDGALLTIAGSGTLAINTDTTQPAARLVVSGTTMVDLAELRIKATNEDIDITKLTINVADGGLTGRTGDYTQVAKAYLKLDGVIVGNTSGYSVAQANTTINLQRGQLTIPQGTTGKKLSVLGDVATIGSNQPGVANADIKVGINSFGFDNTNYFSAYGNGSNSQLATAGFTNTAATGTGIIIHKAVPAVTWVTPTNKLSATSVLHETKVTAVGGNIGLYKLSFVTTTSSGVNVTNAYTKLGADCGVLTNGSVLSDTTAAGTDIAAGIKTWAQAFSNTLNSSYRYLSIGQGQTCTVDLWATIGATSNVDTVSTSLLGDTASTTSDTAYVGGAKAANFNTNDQGNFVWSDLYSDDSQAATSLTVAQWYNGYLVSGIGSVATTTPVTIGE
ncbi:MAG: hypothetical protein WCW02_04385 [Candidatus Buchananbacteria bacterium]